MGKIKNVVFDLGGVLIDWDPRHYFKKYFADTEEMEYFLREICSPGWNTQMDAGKPFEEGVRELQAEHPEYSEAIEHFWKHWADMLGGPIDESVKLLKELKAEDYRVFALTNWSAETFPVALERYDFLKLFEGIVVSGKVKVAKPDKKIFQYLLNTYEIDARETVFIDDNKANIATASSLGFHAFLFDTAANVQSEIAKLK